MPVSKTTTPKATTPAATPVTVAPAAPIPATSLLEVSADNKTWSTSVKAGSGKAATLYFRVTAGADITVATTGRLVFPVLDSSGSSPISPGVALMLINDWNSFQLTALTPAGQQTTSPTQVNGAFAYEFPLQGGSQQVFMAAIPKTTDLATVAGTPKFITVSCGLAFKAGRNWGQSSVVSVNISAQTIPTIGSFSTNRIIISAVEVGLTQLSWEAANADQYVPQVSCGSKSYTPNVANSTANLSGSLATGDNTFTLSFKGLTTTTAQLKINIRTASACELANPGPPFQGSLKLMNLFTRPEPDRLCALVLDTTKANVYMWESFNGCEWKQSNDYSQVPAFISKKNTANVPLAFAGSPSVVYNNKLYLVGGSRFDPNIRSSEIYFYDFGDTLHGWQKAAANASFTPRMGHACVVYSNALWVIGGCDEQGASNDVHAFDGNTWTPQSATLPGCRCMHSAIVNSSQIQIFGGFSDIPGTADVSIRQSYYFDGSGWHAMGFQANIESLKYVACAAAACKNETFIISTIYDTSFTHRVQRISSPAPSLTLEGINTTIALQANNYFCIQAVVYKDVVWLCTIEQDKEIKSNNLWFFFYVKP